jgi:hypothetical protein
LLALLYVPFAAFAPCLLVSGLAAPLLGAVFMGLSSLVLWRFGRGLELSGWLVAGAVVLLALHPLALSYAALGARGAVLLFALLGLSCSLIHWARTERVRDLVTGGIFAAAILLLSYEMLGVVVAAAVFLGWRCRRGPGVPPAKAEGTLITFLMPVVYAMAVWFVADWAILGQPWHFWLTPWRLAAARAHAEGWPVATLTVAMVASPLLLALIYGHCRGRGGRLPGTVAAGMVLLGMLSPAVFPALRALPTDPSPWGALMPLAALAVSGGLALLLSLVADALTPGVDWRRVLSPGFVVIALGTLVVAGHLQVSGKGLPVGIRSAVRGYPAFAREVGDEWRVADRLAGSLSVAKHHVLGGPESFVVGLRVQARDRTHVVGSPAVPLAAWLKQLEAGSWLVLADPLGRHAAAWQRALPPYLRVAKQWRSGPWVAYKLTVQPVLRPSAPNGQSPAAGAIIGPVTHP